MDQMKMMMVGQWSTRKNQTVKRNFIQLNIKRCQEEFQQYLVGKDDLGIETAVQSTHSIEIKAKKWAY